MVCESLDHFKTDHVSLTEQLQCLAVYCELYVFVECGAFRFLNVRRTSECGVRDHLIESFYSVVANSKQR